MFSEMLENVHKKHPLIHCITNYVTANDCANILLACQASPVMADDPCEAAEITASCCGLNINLGTLHRSTVSSMLAAGKKANELHHPVILDPVGVGASSFRLETALKLMSEIHFDVIRGNLSEIKALSSKTLNCRGVDVRPEDVLNSKCTEEMSGYLNEFSLTSNSVTVVTGKTDLVADGSKVFCISNGDSFMSRITGTGCQLSALITAFASANPECIHRAAAAAVCAMGLCGETAVSRMNELDGNSSCRSYIIDAICHLTPERLEGGARYEII